MEVVRRDEVCKAAQARQESTGPRAQWMQRQGGREHVMPCLDFAVWLCQELVDTCPGHQVRSPAS